MDAEDAGGIPDACTEDPIDLLKDRLTRVPKKLRFTDSAQSALKAVALVLFYAPPDFRSLFVSRTPQLSTASFIDFVLVVIHVVSERITHFIAPETSKNVATKMFTLLANAGGALRLKSEGGSLENKFKGRANWRVRDGTVNASTKRPVWHTHLQPEFEAYAQQPASITDFSKLSEEELQNFFDPTVFEEMTSKWSFDSLTFESARGYADDLSLDDIGLTPSLATYGIAHGTPGLRAINVGIFGTVCSGKSTFLNALLNEKVLSTGSGSTTQQTTGRTRS